MSEHLLPGSPAHKKAKHRHAELDAALRGLAMAGAALPPAMLDERDGLERRLRVAVPATAAPLETIDPFGTLDEEEQVHSVLPVSVPKRRD